MNAAAIKRFIRAGNATFTIQSVETGTHFTFVLAAPPRRKTHDRFARVLIGPEVWADLGVVVNASLLPTRGSKVSEKAPSFRALAWFLRELERTPDDSPPAKVIFRHEGRCGRCGRPLTTPASIDTGLGPDCAEMLGVEHGATRGPSGAKVQHLPPLAKTCKAQRDGYPYGCNGKVGSHGRCEDCGARASVPSLLSLLRPSPDD